MIERIQKILTNSQVVDGWKIVEKKSNSREVFFVRKELDMNRVKDVCLYRIAVYKDFEENGIKYRGSALTNIYPTMSDTEIAKAVEDAAFNASLIKNEYYPLVQPSDIQPATFRSTFADQSLSAWLPGLIDAVYAPDIHQQGWLNSTELFLEQQTIRIVNSEGVDVVYDGYNGFLEFICSWLGNDEEVELFNTTSFADYRPEELTRQVEELLMASKERSAAKPTPALKKHTVLLTGDPVKEIFQYYYDKSNVRSVYEGISTLKLGEHIQGDAKGDLINMGLDPFLANSTASKPYDADGCPLSYVEVFENGVLKNYWGDVRFSYYQGVPPTGNIENIVVKGGSKTIAEMQTEPYLEVLAFSDFQVDTVTGSFIGEIRLGWYFDGKDRYPVSGGSVSGNLLEVQKEMYFSKELQLALSRKNYDLNFSGPKTIQMYNVTVAGNE